MSADTLKAAAGQFLRGWLDSWRWALVIHRLDRVPSTAAAAAAAEDKPAAPLTSLALRRQQAKLREAAATGAAPAAPSTPEPSTPKRRPSAQLAACVAANVGGLLCLWAVQLLLRLAGLDEESGLAWALSLAFQTFWVVPYFAVTRVVNVLWFQDIANASMRQLDEPPPPSKGSISLSVADFVLAIVLETLFLVQAYVVKFLIPIPWIGVVVQTGHLALLHSLYAFEYRWAGAGVGLSERLERMQESWPYFLGFGLTLCLATAAAPSAVLSGCLFGAAFPLLLIASFQATPPRTAVPGLRLPLFQPSLTATSRLSLRLMRALTQGRR